MSQKPVENDAEAIRKKYGEDADLYAATRSEAANEAGRKKSADHWEKVATEVDEDPSSVRRDD